MARRAPVAILMMILAGSAGRGFGADPAPVSEYDVKAAFLYNFAKFVEWPERSFSGQSSPLVIGILGEDPFGRTLELLIQGRTVRERNLVVQHCSRVEDAASSHVLFISTSEEEHLDEILRRLRNTSVLTVGETGDFERRGGIIRFTLRGNNVRFAINDKAARQADLKISSHLLRLAETSSN
jgi:hypothetical protein